MPKVDREVISLEPVYGNRSGSNRGDAGSRWTFMTNHFLVLVAISGSPDLRVRDIANHVGITERATQAILGDLVEAGFVERIRIGRRNRYKIRRAATLRHPLVSETRIGDLLDVMRPPTSHVAAG